SPFTSSSDHLANVRSGHWSAPLARKHKRASTTTMHLAQSSKLVALDWVNRSDATLQSPYVEIRPGEVNSRCAASRDARAFSFGSPSGRPPPPKVSRLLAAIPQRKFILKILQSPAQIL